MHKYITSVASWASIFLFSAFCIFVGDKNTDNGYGIALVSVALVLSTFFFCKNASSSFCWTWVVLSSLIFILSLWTVKAVFLEEEYFGSGGIIGIVLGSHIIGFVLYILNGKAEKGIPTT